MELKNIRIRTRARPQNFAILLTLCLLSACAAGAAPAQTNSNEGTIDEYGNVYVPSEDGQLIKVTETFNCSGVAFTPDRQIFGCRVKELLRLNGRWESMILEIYRRGGKRTTIELESNISEWRFWKSGEQVAVIISSPDRPPAHLLYDVATGNLVEKIVEPEDDRTLPEWAKSRLQIESEAVPVGPSVNQQRKHWIEKILYQTGKIREGMQRKDILKLFGTEAGPHAPGETTFFLIECPYVLIDVRFESGSTESGDDVIASVSKPYLAWGGED